MFASLLLCVLSGAGAGVPEDAVFRQAIEADWDRQESRNGRDAASVEAIEAVLNRGALLLEKLSSLPDAQDMAEERRALDALRGEALQTGRMVTSHLREVYLRARWLVRGIAFKNPLVPKGPVAFLECRRFICQMLHEYLGYYYDYADIAGGGVYVLDTPGASMAARELVDGRLPRGNVTTLALSYDAKTLYFAFASRGEGTPSFYRNRQCFHLFAMDVDGANLRQLTSGPDDDFDPCPLPDGGFAFMSSRRGGFTRCNNPWEPLPAHTLHRMDADGGHLRTLSFHETSEWQPCVLHDGSICYTRWDYVDRSAANYHGLWLSNPDGTNPRILFGNYLEQINACYQAHAIPGSNKIAFIAGAHHANVGGSLVLLDPDAIRLDPDSGDDDLAAIERLTPEICFPEGEDWPTSYFHSPWPLSEDFFLISFSYDPLPGMSGKTKEENFTGLYLFDRFGGLELLYQHEGVSAMYPIPLAPREMPPALADTRVALNENTGEFLLTDVGQSFFAMPEGRPVRELRIFQVLPKSETHVANRPRLGYANAESARVLLGTVPVEEDGSAYFHAPAGKPLLFQAVDENGRGIQTMRSVTYLQPGERRSCVGCHEPRQSAPPKVAAAAAFLRAPSDIVPGPDGVAPWSFMRLVQPILDARCVTCHNGEENAAKPDLRSAPVHQFTVAYENLRDYSRWYEWGDSSIRRVNSRPGEMPSDSSPLTAVIDDDHHAGKTGLTEEERRHIYLWLDGNAAFYGAYSVPEQLAQRRGEALRVPALQ